MLPPRSLLYVPADNARALAKIEQLQKAGEGRPDGIILDLEDAVAPEHKALAREQARAALQAGFTLPMLLRINAKGTPWAAEDLQLGLTAGAAGLVLPKAEDPQWLSSLPRQLALWPMIETPRGVLNAPVLAVVPGVVGLLAGSNDLALGLRAHPGPERQELQYALQAVVLAARAAERWVLDAVYNQFRDTEGFAAECQQGQRLGFDGKTLIHPAQVAAANQIYGVSEAEAQQAQALLEAWQQARAQGLSVLNYAGQMVEELHIRRAQAVLERHQAQRP